MVDPPCQADRVDHEEATAEELEVIASELARIARSGQVLPGSLAQRATRCGRANCACHNDPPRLHGPYWQWTRKVAKKTVGRWLSAEQAARFKPFIDNDRRLHELLARLEAIGLSALEGDRASGRRP